MEAAMPLQPRSHGGWPEAVLAVFARSSGHSGLKPVRLQPPEEVGRPRLLIDVLGVEMAAQRRVRLGLQQAVQQWDQSAH